MPCFTTETGHLTCACSYNSPFLPLASPNDIHFRKKLHNPFWSRSAILNAAPLNVSGMVPILYGTFLNHTTIITKVGASYDHVNNDVPEVDSISHGCYQALSLPKFFRREPRNKASNHPTNSTNDQSLAY